MLLYTAGGAAAGAAVDLATGGVSFLTGTLIGAAAGASAGIYQLGRRFAHVSSPRDAFRDLQKAWSGSRNYRIGPHAHVNFPWILLDRSLLHYRAVLGRSHARQDAISLESGAHEQGYVATIDAGTRKELDRLFRGIRKEFKAPSAKLSDELHRKLRDLLESTAESWDGMS